MSVSSLYIKNKTTFTPPVNQTTYQQFVFEMERNGTNDLVERDMVDPTFRPPLVSDSYEANNFKVGSNLL